MNIGFTGTRKGMSGDQLIIVRAVIVGINQSKAPQFRRDGGIEIHHGMCPYGGADKEFHDLVRELTDWHIIGHPCDLLPIDDYIDMYPGLYRMERVKKPLVRDQDIVSATVRMYATPLQLGQPRSTRGSGTWATIKMARAAKEWLRIIYRDGSVGE